jgi:hypothetical protein
MLGVLSQWFPLLDQVSPGVKALVSIAIVTALVCSVVVYVVFHGRKGDSE